MIKEKYFPIISYCLIVFALLFGMTQENGLIIGGFILSKFGFPVWSNGLDGIYYPGVISIVLVLIALFAFSRSSENSSPRFKMIVLITLIFGPIILRPMVAETYAAVKSFSTGLNTIEYYRNESSATFQSTEDKYIIINAKLNLTNHSKNEKVFYIKLVPVDWFKTDMIVDAELIAKDKALGEPKQFKLHPKSKTKLNASFFAKPRGSIQGALGQFSDVDIVIFDEIEEKKFIRGSY